MSEAETPVDLQKYKVLLIEDERLIREIILRMLRNIGVTNVTEASSAEAGWEHLVGEKRRPFDVIMTDLTLPGMSGGALIKRLRALPSPAAKAMPVIVLTGSTDLATYKRVAANNVSSYLVKPISADILRGAIAKAVVPASPRPSPGRQAGAGQSK